MPFVAVSIAEEKQFSDILGKCWEGNSHPDMSGCVAKHAKESRQDLERFERQLRHAITETEEGGGFTRAHALESFVAGVKAFTEYRRQQCGYVSALASMGNGAEDNRLGCEAQLNLERIAQLKATYHWVAPPSLPNKSLERTRAR